MNPVQIKLLAVSGALVVGITMLALEGSRSATVYYQTITEFRSTTATSSKVVRITGYVEEDSIVREAGEPVVFTMRDKERTANMQVAYSGIVPDTFKDRAEVVVEGKVGADGRFEASTLLAKCPSKYESEEGARGGAVAENRSY